MSFLYKMKQNMGLKIESGVSCKQGKMLLTIQLSKSRNIYSQPLPKSKNGMAKQPLHTTLQLRKMTQQLPRVFNSSIMHVYILLVVWSQICMKYLQAKLSHAGVFSSRSTSGTLRVTNLVTSRERGKDREVLTS